MRPLHKRTLGSRARKTAEDKSERGRQRATGVNGNEGLESDVGQDYSYRVCVQAQGQLVYMRCLIFILDSREFGIVIPIF